MCKIKNENDANRFQRIKDFFLLSWVHILVLLGICTAIRLLKVFYNDPITRDSVMYCQWAETWAKTGKVFHPALFGAKFIPLYIWGMKCGIKNGLTAVQTGLIINMVCGILLVVICYYIAKDLFHDSALAFFSGLLIAVHPKTVEYSCVVLREAPFLLFTGLMLFCSIKAWQKDKKIWYCLAGVSAALAMSVRIEGIEYVFTALLIMFLALFFPKIRRRILVGGTLFLICHICLFAFISFLLDANTSFYREMIQFRGDTIVRNFQSE